VIGMVGKIAVSKPQQATTKDVESDEAVTRIWSTAAREVQSEAPAIQARRLRSMKRADARGLA
jgi:hypothetical protein